MFLSFGKSEPQRFYKHGSSSFETSYAASANNNDNGEVVVDNNYNHKNVNDVVDNKAGYTA